MPSLSFTYQLKMYEKLELKELTPAETNEMASLEAVLGLEALVIIRQLGNLDLDRQLREVIRSQVSSK